MKPQMSDVGPNLSPAELQKVEKAIGRQLSPEYRRFLLQNNGGRPTPSYFRIEWKDQEWAKGWEVDFVHYFLKVKDGPGSLLGYCRTFEGRIPPDTIPIAYDQGGNLVLLGTGATNSGRVFFWMHSYEVDVPDYSNVGFVANNVDEFLESLFDGE